MGSGASWEAFLTGRQFAPLRVSGLARSLLENKDNPAEVERIAAVECLP